MLDTLSLDKMDIREEMSFYKNEENICPACGKTVLFEEIKTGGGRLDAGPLHNDLHRVYFSSDKFGDIYPFIYSVATCNNCYFSAFKFDYSKKLQKGTLENIAGKAASKKRVKILDGLYGTIPDFSTRNNLIQAVASYLLAISTYEQFESKDVPTIRMGVAAMRAAWTCEHLLTVSGEEDLSLLMNILYRKAFFFYDKALELSVKQHEGEDLTEMYHIGPDSDKDYGYDGVIYLHAWLYINHGIEFDLGDREHTLSKIRSSLSKVFGFGKSSKEKPSLLLEIAREAFDTIEKSLKKLV